MRPWHEPGTSFALPATRASPPKVRFATDSLLEEAVWSELVSEYTSIRAILGRKKLVLALNSSQNGNSGADRA